MLFPENSDTFITLPSEKMEASPLSFGKSDGSGVDLRSAWIDKSKPHHTEHFGDIFFVSFFLRNIIDSLVGQNSILVLPNSNYKRRCFLSNFYAS